ncbi:MAG: hypothetical protein ACYCWW_18865 [Deltaproteobacteria bacterium]
MRRIAGFALSCALASSLACQEYRFRQVTPLPVHVIHQHPTISAVQKPPYVMIVQDTSGSMNEPIQLQAPNGDSCISPNNGYASCALDNSCPSSADDADCQTRMVLTAQDVQGALNQLKPAAGALFVGLASFPYTDPKSLGPSSDQCQAGAVEVSVQDAVEGIPAIDGWYTSLLANSNQPSGGTPTAATLSIAVANDSHMSDPDPSVPKYVILVTDGLPNCDSSHPCGSEPWSDGVAHGCESVKVLATQGTNATPPTGCVCSFGTCPDPSAKNAGATCCPANSPLYCLDDQASINAVAGLKANQNITTYVVGLGYDYNNGTILDAMAAAGGTGTHLQANDPATLQSTLAKLLQSVTVSCKYTLDAPPANPALIEVTLDGQPLTQGDPNGYSFLPPDQITLDGTACTTVTNGQQHDLEITAISQ